MLYHWCVWTFPSSELATGWCPKSDLKSPSGSPDPVLGPPSASSSSHSLLLSAVNDISLHLLASGTPGCLCLWSLTGEGRLAWGWVSRPERLGIWTVGMCLGCPPSLHSGSWACAQLSHQGPARRGLVAGLRTRLSTPLHADRSGTGLIHQESLGRTIAEDGVCPST